MNKTVLLGMLALAALVLVPALASAEPKRPTPAPAPAAQPAPAPAPAPAADAAPAPAPAAAAPTPAPAPAPAAPAAAPAATPEAAPAAATPAPAAEEPVPEVEPKPTMIEDAYGFSDDVAPVGSRLEWAARRDLRVIQKRSVLKEGRHGFTLFGGVVPNDDFFTYITGGLGYNYYFSEDLALSIHGAYTYDQKTSLESSLSKPRETNEGPGLEVRLPQVLQSYASAGIDWNLLHGKVGFFTTNLLEFDLALSFGAGAVMTTITPKGQDPFTQFDPAGNVGAGLQFYLTNSFALRLDYHQFFYPALRGQPGGGGVSYPIAATVALTYFTAGLQ
jgi:outer membrane beta-barrel protein